MDTKHTNAKIIPITARKVENGMMRLKLNVHLHAQEVRYIHTQIVDQNYELLITLIYIWIN